jgi:hypothetical protein
LLPHLPPIMLILGGGKKRADRRLVSMLVPLSGTGRMKHATPVEEDAPPAGNAHGRLARLAAAAEVAVAFHARASGRRSGRNLSRLASMRSASSSYAGGRPLRQQMPSQPVLRAEYLQGRHEIESWI